MRTGGHKRQVLLFFAAILLPAAVLIGLMARIIIQEQELTGKRAADERYQATEQVHRELSSRLEAIRLQQVNRLIRGVRWTDPPEDPAVVFVAKPEADRLLLPWDPVAHPPTPLSAEFIRLRATGERLEFIARDYKAAAAAYRQALGVARGPAERAEGRLLLARTLGKAGNSDQAFREFFSLIEQDGDARDEQGVAFSLYAAERLLDGKREQWMVLDSLVQRISESRWMTPGEALMLHSMLASIPEEKATRAMESLAIRTAEIEQGAALASDFAHVRAQMDSAAPSGATWIAYGKEPWLITLLTATAHQAELAIVVSSGKAAPPGVKLAGRTSHGNGLANSLGDNFPGVHVEWPPNRFAGLRNSPIGLYLAGAGLILGFIVVGGYVLLRDVHRDVRLSEVRSQFVASVSHELKTPLTSIRMFAETLSLGRCSDEHLKTEYLDTIVNESERLARLVDNVLDFAKIEQGKMIYRFRPSNLAAVAGSAARAMQYPLSQEGFSLRLSLDENLPTLHADPDALEQAILNLLTNAMKYSGHAREIDLRVTSPNGDALIEVTDHGLGIAPEEQKQIFQKFYRARSHAGTAIAGTGLGLTLVAHIAQAHGGRVDVRSAPGAGSTFSLRIPIEQRV